MNLTTAQFLTLKADLAANTNTVSVNGASVAINAMPHNSDTAVFVAKWYNLDAVPDYWVWKFLMSKAECTNQLSVDATAFNWTGNGFITRSPGELVAWQEIFNSTHSCDPSLSNVRQAFQDIFSGTGNAAANRTHLLAVGRKKATNVEKLFAAATTGPGNAGAQPVGSTANPAAMSRTANGLVAASEIERAWETPG